MNALVGYESSDEEDDDVVVERPSKAAKIERDAEPLEETKTSALAPVNASPLPQPVDDEPPPGASRPPPSAASSPAPLLTDEDGNPLSPFTYERKRLHDLTMPTVPNFVIPGSPPYPLDLEERADLAGWSKKLTGFLDRKRKGQHFNLDLENSSSARNPALLSNLMGFAKISQDDSYASTLPSGSDLGSWTGVPSRWPREAYVEQLLKENERIGKKRLKGRGKLDFVPAKSKKER